MTEQRNPPATALQRDSRDGRVPKSLVSERMFGYSGGGPAQAKRGVRICRGENGWGSIVITLSDLEVEEFASALRAFIDLRYRPGRPVDESPCATRRLQPCGDERATPIGSHSCW